MLDEGFEPGDSWSESDDCGCWVAKTVIDGVEVEAHHWIPDDTAPHVPDTECGCGPIHRSDAQGVMLFEHLDQDDPEASGLFRDLVS